MSNFRLLRWHLPKLQRHAPPGLNIAGERNWYVLLMTLATLWSTIYLFAYAEAYDRLFAHRLGVKTLQPQAQMPPFARLMENTMVLFPLLGLLILAAGADHYLYHHRGSKSIYTMRRLPDRWLLHRRCLTLPLAALTFTALWVLALIGVYAAIYQFVTPAGCLPPDAWVGFWRALL